MIPRYGKYIAITLLSLLLPICSVLYAFQEKLQLKHISRDLGLPNITVKTIIQDQKGFIWIGLELGGLAKFDGSEFTLYTNEPGNPNTLSSDFVNALYEDAAGNLWIGTENGLNLLTYHSDTIKRIQSDSSAPSSIGDNIIHDIIEDSNGRIWVGTEIGVFRMDKNSREFELVPVEGMIANSQCNSIFQDSRRRIWFATKSGALLYNEDSNELVRPAEIDFGDRSIRSQEFFDIVEDDNGNLWFGHQTGLGHYQNDTQTYTELDLSGRLQDPEETNVGALLKDSRGYIWIGTFSDGLRILDPRTKRIHTYRSDPFNADGIKSNSIRALTEDSNGLVWIGTKFEGLFLYDKNVETFPLWTGTQEAKSGMRGSFVLSLLDDEEGTLWVGTKSGGLNGFERSQNRFASYYQQENNPNSLFDNRVEAIFKDRNGILWLGTEKGLSSFDRNTRTFENFSSRIVREIVEEDNGDLYVGTNYGLEVFHRDTKTFTDFPIYGGIDLSTNAAKEIKAMFRDSRGILYIGTHHNGLYAFDSKSKQITPYLPDSNSKTAISGEMIRSIFEDSRGDIWVGTRFKGLNKFDPATGIFTHYTASDGLPSNTIFGITEDSNGYFWLTTDFGLCKFNPTESTAVSFTESYGLQNNVFEPNAIYKNKSGEIFIGGVGGFNAFRPEGIEKRDYHSDVILSSLSVFDTKIPEEQLDSGSITLPYDQNYITFSFSLTDYSSSGQNVFSYKLEGLDDEWIYSGRRNYSTYASLAPGKYRFVVRGKLPNGQWQSNGAHLNITILPPFWETTGFLLIVGILGISLVTVIYLFLTKRQRWRQIELESTVEKRTSELKEANITLKEQSDRIQTQKELLEEHKNNLEEKVRQRTADLEEQKRKAEESDRLKSSFLANMSHEIRTPMNAIVGFSSMICDTKTNAVERKEYNGIIKKSCSTLLSLIDDILDISRIEAGEMRIEKRIFDLHELLLELYGVFTNQIQLEKLNDIELQLTDSIGPEARMIESDPDRLKQILINLVSNAIKFTPEGTVRLTYNVNSTQGTIVFKIEDTGIGIDPENIEIIWDRFRKIEDDDERLFRGTGLGLSITKNLVELLGGSIAVQSQIGVGTTFTFEIPYSPVQDISKGNGQGSQPSEVPDSTDISTSTILVVEDEDNNYLLIEKILNKDNHLLIRAKNGKEALTLFKENASNIGLVLMDIKIPKLDGRKAAREILKTAPSIPIIAHTAYATQEERREIMSHGFVDYISKPISQDRLIQILNTYLLTKTRN